MCRLHLEAVAVNHTVQSKDLFIQEKHTIVMLKKQNRSIRERERESRNIRSSQINSLVNSEKKYRTGELRNIKRPGCPWKTTVVMIGESSP